MTRPGAAIQKCSGMNQFIIIGLDNTINAAWDRDDLMQQGWDMYHAACVNDQPIKEAVDLINSLSVNFTIVGVTQRPKRYHAPTLAWLTRNKVNLSDVKMRHDADFRSSPLVKYDLVSELVGGEEEIKKSVACVIDSSEPVLQAFAGIGITTLHFRAGRNSVE
jgi:hypothetical protein